MMEQSGRWRAGLSAVLIVRNEAHCLERCLRSIAGIADEIVVLDSGSTDDTVAVARAFGAKVEIADWPGYGAQKNRALARATREWVLAFVADERVDADLAAAIRAAVDSPRSAVNGYLIRFVATWCGTSVRFGDWGSKLHLRLFRRECARFTEVPVHERVVCPPPHAALDGIMIHDTVATEAEAEEKTLVYAGLGAHALAERGRGGSASAFAHGAWTFVRGYLLKRGFRDGAIGWRIAREMTRRTWMRYRLAGEIRARRRALRSRPPRLATVLKIGAAVLLVMLVADCQAAPAASLVISFTSGS
jgi:glycosyltransferase involved in cell wall biosynthesis